MSLDIRHIPERHRFEVVVEGERCELVYRLASTTMTIVHTGVPAPVAGRGIAAALMKQALDTARAAGWKVVPACEYAAAYFQRHREYDDLLAG